jgi:anti-sigma factor (TIGR02949 family)
MDCKEAVVRLWEYLDQELGPKEAAEIVAHLRGCDRCSGIYRCNKAFLSLLARQRSRCAAPPTLLVSLRTLLLSA